MKKLLLFTYFLSACFLATAQGITTHPNGGNQKSTITQWIGPVSVTITYRGPDVHAPNGTDRKGHIWGELVPYGFTDQGFGVKAAPWRAGANENTTISFSHDVKIDGKDIKAGTYGVFLDVEKEGNWNWIFSKNSSSWGSYYYDVKEDALRSGAMPVDAPYMEWLTYGFEDRLLSSAVAYLHWENKKISFKIEVPNVNDIYVSIIRDELRGYTGFDYQNWVTAVQFCAQNKVNLEEALTWADYANTLAGQDIFYVLQAKAQVLMALNRANDASVVMDKAIKLPDATLLAVHQYGRSLLTAGQNQKALEVFQHNFKMHPEEKFTTYVGLARGYTAVGDKKNAIKNWEIAIKNVPGNQKQNVPSYEAELKKLKESK
jgi:Protein of unknown function (DUF2911)